MWIIYRSTIALSSAEATFTSAARIIASDLDMAFALIKWIKGLRHCAEIEVVWTAIVQVGADWLHALPSLLELHLSSCELESLPPSLPFVNSTSLFVLDLSNNQFNSSIPQWLLNLTSLTKLDLRSNSLQGSIPYDFVNLRNLEHLDLRYNQIRGQLPSFCGNLCKLKTLDLSWNNFYGNIDGLFGNSSACLNNSLESLDLRDVIPKEWVSKASELTFLDLSYNQIMGPIPLSFTNVVELSLQGNLFSGPIPSNINDVMPKLKMLDLSENHLNGTIPLSIMKLNDLEGLFLRSNQLSGELPHHWNESQRLLVVDISYNNLSGKIPSSMGFLSSLDVLVLSNNNLHGEIPSSLQNCSLYSIDLGGNHLSGNLPLWIQLDILIIRLRSNLFSGIIPRQLCNLQFLHILDLAQNNIFGGIPDCLDNLTALVYGNSSRWTSPIGII
ncbi:receptor-like protein EIX1 [Fagus crenata]